MRCYHSPMSDMPVSNGSPTTDEERIWHQFLAWVPTVDPGRDPGELILRYKEHLLASAVPPAEIGTHLGVIPRLMRIREDGWQQIFNSIFKSATPAFTAEPNALLASAISERTPGRALDAGMGQGRNAVYLALQGWDVTGFDVSDEGLAVARADAARAGVSIRAVQTGGHGFNYGIGEWDLIVFTYVPFPLVNAEFTSKLYDSLRRDGLLVIESFSTPRNAERRRPVDIDPTELAPALSRFDVLLFEEASATADWTLSSTQVVRAIARKA